MPPASLTSLTPTHFSVPGIGAAARRSSTLDRMRATPPSRKATAPGSAGKEACARIDIKALKRIRENLKGGGKEGIDAIYDANKVKFFSNELYESLLKDKQY